MTYNLNRWYRGEQGRGINGAAHATRTALKPWCSYRQCLDTARHKLALARKAHQELIKLGWRLP